ncbi:MAG: ATP-dependent DNA helicase RecG, partial [Bdellovibrionales bacterium]|nr:ATP-dependent DNA helicase RecG [Bdellovibrionales bacterium]
MKSSASSTSKKHVPSTPVQFLKGVGPARARLFSRKGIETIHDLLYFFPRKHEDRRRLMEPADLAVLPEGLQVTVLARIENVREVPLKGRRLFEVTCMGSGGGLLSCTWFRTWKGQKEKFQIGTWAIFTGQLKKFRGAPQLVHPDVEHLKEKPGAINEGVAKSVHWGRLTPLYSRIEGVSQKFLRETIFDLLEKVKEPDLLPASIRSSLSLLPLQRALAEMHFPEREAPDAEETRPQQLHPAIRRLVFEEFFKFQLLLLMDRSGVKEEPGIPLRVRNVLARKARANIPYTLTQAQERVIAEVLADLQRSNAMNRIVQGDVGSGKTFVAFLTMAEAADNGLQSALMAPTEILAEQHYQTAQKIFQGTGVNVGYLAGSLPRAEKLAAQEKIRSGEWHVVIGTHALIQEAVEWKRLALAVIDEQHRFGVRQRAYLKEKAPARTFPHILTMTATPIPRSLALTVFGELAVSTIDELPPGRAEVTTKVIRGKDRDRLYGLIHKEVAEGRQAYVVYPLVQESEAEGMERVRSAEEEFARLKAHDLKGLRVGLVHGQMKAEERNSVMRAFKAREFDVLVSTTVIEVGVDVPNATVMAIENAERFGLSQLHQLRGRVGRSGHKGWCVLVTDAPPPRRPHP